MILKVRVGGRDVDALPDVSFEEMGFEGHRTGTCFASELCIGKTTASVESMLRSDYVLMDVQDGTFAGIVAADASPPPFLSRFATPRCIYIHSLCVASARRGKDIGSRLMRTLLEDHQSRDALLCVRLPVGECDECRRVVEGRVSKLRSFYPRLGFRKLAIAGDHEVYMYMRRECDTWPSEYRASSLGEAIWRM